jgi:hypothetical protein
MAGFFMGRWGLRRVAAHYNANQFVFDVAHSAVDLLIGREDYRLPHNAAMRVCQFPSRQKLAYLLRASNALASRAFLAMERSPAGDVVLHR